MAVKIHESSDYEKFHAHHANRCVGENPKLLESMRKYGWIAAYPAHVVRNGSGYLVIDGQHRIKCAQQLGINICYVVEPDNKVSIADINNTQRKWSIADYLSSYLKQGNEHYAYVKRFHDETNLPLAVCIGLLNNETYGGNGQKPFKAGTFKVRTAETAWKVADLLSFMSEHTPLVRQSYLAYSVSKLVRVREFDIKRFKKQFANYAYLLKKQPDTHGYLDNLELIYNRNSTKRVPLKFLAEEITVMRNPFVSKGEKAKRGLKGA